jgi:tetratricopeptide (TPR) repeat protein
MISVQKKQQFSILAGVLLITGLVFSPMLGNHFTNWDDGALLVDNPDIYHNDPINFKNIFTKTYVGTYIPLTLLSFKLEHAIFQSTPFFYYLDNLLLHLGVVALIFFVGQRFGLSVMSSGLAALLFGIHPMHVESVAWISQRKDVLYSLFYLLAVLQYWNYLEQKKKRFYGWAFLFALLSILAKPMAYSLPLILLLCDWWKGRAFDWKIVAEKVPFFVLIGALSLVTYSANAHVTPLNIFQVVLVWAWVFAFHLQKFFFPYPLLTVYGVPHPIMLGQPDFALAVAVCVALGIFLVAFRQRRWLILAIVFYAVSVALLVLSSIWDWGTHTRVADRFMYLPSLGMCLALGAGYQYLQTHTRYQRLISVFCTIIFLGLISLSVGQVCVWKNNVSLWSHVLQNDPANTLALQNRAAGYVEQGKYELAMKDLDHALSLAPKSAILYFCRADLLVKQGSLDQALIDLRRSLELNPDDAQTYYLRAGIYQQIGQSEKALEDYGAAIAKNQNFDRAFYNRAMIYDDLGKPDLALADYAQVIRINPQHPKVYNNRAVIYINAGEYEKAQVDLLKAIRIDSHNSRAYGNLGIVAYVKKDGPLAVKYLEQAIALDANNKEARDLLIHIKGDRL